MLSFSTQTHNPTPFIYLSAYIRDEERDGAQSAAKSRRSKPRTYVQRREWIWGGEGFRHLRIFESGCRRVSDVRTIDRARTYARGLVAPRTLSIVQTRDWKRGPDTSLKNHKCESILSLDTVGHGAGGTLRVAARTNRQCSTS